MATFQLANWNAGTDTLQLADYNPFTAAISAADDAVEAQSETVTITGNTADPTELRLGGSVVAFTFNAGVLTYTAPLLSNNDALVVEVDVDGFTLSTTIAYSNTYSYTHTPGSIDDNSILPDSSFGTTQLVELKVITDATASVLTIDWDGYDADNFASAVADFVTPVSDVAASTDVTMGYHITETGATGTFTRTLSVTDADLTAPALTSPTASATGQATASGSVTTDEGNGTLFYLTTANASEAASNIISLGDSQAVSATGVQSVTITGLTADTAYYTHYVHQDAAGNNSTVSVSAQFTTEAAPVVAPTGSVTFGTPTITDTTISQPTSYAGSDATGFERRIDGGAWVSYTSPIDLASLTAETAYLIEARATNSAGAGPIASVTRTTSAEPGQVPQGTITFDTPDIDGDSISQPFSYDAADATGFESRIDGGAAQADPSPVDVFSLDYEQTVQIEVRAVNDTGPGQWFSVSRTTDAEPAVLPDGIGPGRDNVINPGSTFVITSTITSVAAGESLLAFITIGGIRYYLTIMGWNAGDITVTAPGNLPVSASPELTVQKISLIAA